MGYGRRREGTREREIDRAVQRLGSACAAAIGAGTLSPVAAARFAAAMQSGLARSFVSQVANALRIHPAPLKRRRLEEALEAAAGRLLSEGEFSTKEAARYLSLADECLRTQATISGSGLRSCLRDPVALADLLHRYRRRRDLLPILVAKLSDALRRMLTRPLPVTEPADTGRLDFRATMRESRAYGGLPIEFRYRRRREESEIVLALDTSGSQRAWAASAVLAAHALHRLLPRLRAFSFTSSTVEVTRDLARPERFIERLEDYAGFSNYQTALLDLERSGVVTPRTTLIVVGDCRDAQGEWLREESAFGRPRYVYPESARVVARLVKRCRRVVILNPDDPSRWSQGDGAATHYADAGAAVLHVRSPLHLAAQLSRLALARR